MTYSINLDLMQPDYGFQASDAYGNVVRLDTSPDTGGQNYGVRPMQMMLMAMGGCSGIDVVSILKKQKQEIKGFRMSITAEREKDKEPAVWIKAHIVFSLTGNIEPDKANRAAALSIDKYCSVAETLRRAGCTITYETVVNENEHNPS